ncbi:MAG: outer membrane beta-barrel protein [Oligoflexia bacterium]|nr:outer membrane beta-barrel protein [Oligoflexia bacterium]
MLPTRIMKVALLSTALLAGPAAAADNELSLELGSFGTSDSRFDMIQDSAAIGTVGGRIGLALLDNLSVVAGYHRGTWGSQVDVNEVTQNTDFQIAYQGNQVLLGPKADVRVTDWFSPYVTLQGGVFFGRVLLDEDAVHDDNVNQIAANGWAPGGVAALGFDLVPVRQRKRLRFGTHLEMGTGLVAASSFSATPPGGGDKVEIARFGFGGFYMRWGIGAYF